MFTTMNPIYSPESISFQNDSFFKALQKEFDTYRGGDPKKNSTELEIALAKCIKDYTNINVVVEIGDFPTAITPPKIDRNSPVIEGYGWEGPSLAKDSLSAIRKSSDKEVRGLLDPAAGYVNGFFADLDPSLLTLNLPMIYGASHGVFKYVDKREFTTPELAGTVIHELGHVWTFFWMLVHFRTTNQILSATMRQLDGTEDHGKREIIIREATQALSLAEIDAQDLSNKKGTTVYSVFITNLARRNSSQSGSEGYDLNTWEMMADQYAARFGAGRAVVTALDKLEAGIIYRRGWAAYAYVEFTKLALLGLGIGTSVAGLGMTSMFFFTLMSGMMLGDSQNDWYDKSGYRFKRIRNQLVENLKDPTVNKEDSARIREDIDVIDDITKKYKDHTQVVGLIYDYLIPTGVSKRKQIEFQQNLEELASNKLFLYANRLKFA